VKSICVRNLRKVFENKRGECLTVLDGINFEVDAGEFTCFLGPSGCGKSILLQIIANLVPPTSGEIYIGEASSEMRGCTIGFVFQNPRLIPWMTVEGNIEYILKTKRMSKVEMEEKIGGVLTTLDLYDFRKYYPHQLSGGMQQRVSIARVLAYDAGIILMDEPFSHLDEITARTLRRELVDLWRQTRKTILFVTHDILEACFLGSKIVLLTPKPTQISRVMSINLSHPREYGNEELFSKEREVLIAFEDSLYQREKRINE
jgi:ABC-type nitrate/sulfonate/bicarbonate transport system ATPase subunit